MNETPKTDQWLLSGDCSICRRRKYCSKLCKRGKQRYNAELRMMVAKAMAKVMFGKE